MLLEPPDGEGGVTLGPFQLQAHFVKPLTTNLLEAVCLKLDFIDEIGSAGNLSRGGRLRFIADGAVSE